MNAAEIFQYLSELTERQNPLKLTSRGRLIYDVLAISCLCFLACKPRTVVTVAPQTLADFRHRMAHALKETGRDDATVYRQIGKAVELTDSLPWAELIDRHGLNEAVMALVGKLFALNVRTLTALENSILSIREQILD